MSDKIIHWPVEPRTINQGFGDNQSCVDIETGKEVITCDGLHPPEGYKSLYGPKGHLGLDLKAYYSQPVYCSLGGTVYEIDTQARSGLDVRIFSKVNGRYIRHIYEHLLGYQHKVGDIVQTGQVIGWADNTGYSSGNHLHFQVEEMINGVWTPIDPLSVLSDLSAPKALLIENKLIYLREQVALLAERIADYLRTRKQT